VPLDPIAESEYYRSRAFDSEHTREVRRHYLQFVEGREFLVELGCGRGEFLELARATVDTVKGVDSDPGMAKQAADLGLDVELADVLDYASTTTDRPDAVFAAHLVEHLSVAECFDLLGAVSRIVPTGGRVILVTPNPACLAMLTADFWSDPTHVRLYTVDLLRFLLVESGFRLVDSGANPLDAPGPPPMLLASNTLEGWGTVRDALAAAEAPAVSVGRPRLTEFVSKGMLATLRRVVKDLRRLRGAVGVLDDRVIELRHQMNHVLERHNETLRFLYPPNEVYVVGERQAEAQAR
jgi:hypothetical protein